MVELKVPSKVPSPNSASFSSVNFPALPDKFTSTNGYISLVSFISDTIFSNELIAFSRGISDGGVN